MTLRSRVIPCLLLQGEGLTKTEQFKPGKYIGDPQNAIRIFNEKAVDELCLLDIAATVKNNGPNMALLERVADQCRMPLAYGGGIKDAATAEAVVRLGVEKVAISSAAIERPRLISETADRIGRQSVSVVLDVKRQRKLRGYNYEVVTHNGTKKTGLDPVDFAVQAVKLGAGEIVINSVDRDGTMEGYDLELAGLVRSAIDSPMTVLGGAGSLDHIKALLDAHGPTGAGVGSFFVFKGPYRAVLINYSRPSMAG